MQSNILIAHEGETLDGLIWRGAGLGPGSLPAVCSANPHVSERVTLDAGDRIILPPEIIETPETTPALTRVQLWN
jgi:phage tail protein X